MMASGPAPQGSKACPNHDVPSTILHCWDDAYCWQAVPFLHNSIFPEQFNFCFISALNIFPVALGFATVLFRKLQAHSNVSDHQTNLNISQR